MHVLQLAFRHVADGYLQRHCCWQDDWQPVVMFGGRTLHWQRLVPVNGASMLSGLLSGATTSAVRFTFATYVREPALPRALHRVIHPNTRLAVTSALRHTFPSAGRRLVTPHQSCTAGGVYCEHNCCSLVGLRMFNVRLACCKLPPSMLQ
jgi:hypothetical protein